jgi:hypothetical protein
VASLTHLGAESPCIELRKGGWSTFVALIPKPETLLSAAFLSVLC